MLIKWANSSTGPCVVQFPFCGPQNLLLNKTSENLDYHFPPFLTNKEMETVELAL